MLRRAAVRLETLPAPRTGKKRISPQDAVRVHKARMPDQLPNTVYQQKAAAVAESSKIPTATDYFVAHTLGGSSLSYFQGLAVGVALGYALWTYYDAECQESLTRWTKAQKG
eukprot:TRINITY_DN3269_c1_g2_i1.p1 TRINITY_DN3269_c1_g2~~TRINITY_DN3269_c1_g2_i1.p1  ORF type:complete len:112 (+),score=8.65 TRINITY_DN3269_c1_g2_i1:63-398(+)